MNYYSGKTVLITGHTGFKGSWLSVWMLSLGATVVGLSNEIPTQPSHFEALKLGNFVEDLRVDVRDSVAVKEAVNKYRPDYVFHLAAQPLVRPSYENPLDTIATNALGTASVLDALRGLDKPVVAVMITSDKAYNNLEWVWGYRETDQLGGKDPYSASKGMAEFVIRTYVESFFKISETNVRVGIARAGNVIGGGDWAVDRIVPDCMNAWSKGKIAEMRSPSATRPWQHVLEPLSGYMALGAHLSKDSQLQGEAFNFGPPSHQNHSVSELINEMAEYWDNIKWKDVSQTREHLHEAGLLKLNCDKALHELKWKPTLEFKETVRMTVEWYKTYYQEETTSMYSFTMNQIKEFINLAKNRQIPWTMAYD